MDGSFQTRPVLCKINGDVVSIGQIRESGFAEWDWNRIADALKFQTGKAGVSLRTCMEDYKSEFQEAQLYFEEFHCRRATSDKGDVSKHAMESRVLVVMLCLVCLRRQTPTVSKGLALSMLKVLLDRRMMGSHSLDVALPLPVSYQRIQFESGLATSLAQWLPLLTARASKWKQLAAKPRFQRRITSTMEQATMSLWLMHLKSCSSTCAWKGLARILWPKALFMLGLALESYALVLADKEPEPAPILKTKGEEKVPQEHHYAKPFKHGTRVQIWLQKNLCGRFPII